MANPNDADLSANLHDLDDLLRSLHETATGLLDEFRCFQEYLVAENKQHEVDLRIFRKGLKAEFDVLDRLVTKSRQPEYDALDSMPWETWLRKRAHLAKTTNIPHYYLWWSVAKQCHGIRGLGRRVHADGSKLASRNKEKPQRKGEEVQVDIIADDGGEWIKISSVTEKRLLFEMAKQGWEDYADHSEISDDADEGTDRSRQDQSYPSSNHTPKLELLRLAESLQRASRSTRIRYRHPRVHMILPNIPPTPHPSIAALLADIRATGTQVSHGSPTLTPQLPSAPRHPHPSPFAHMAPSPPHRPPPTKSLNLDTSLLIALLSDQCHHAPSTLPLLPFPNDTSKSYHAAIKAQMAAEERCALLPNTIYPLLAGRELVVTRQAAERAREIVGVMGTEGERGRGEILLPSQGSEGGEGWEGRWWGLSSYDLPAEGLRLPVREVDVDVPALLVGAEWLGGELARRLYAHMSRDNKLSELNAAVLVYGWAKGMVTVTSNGLAVRAVEKGLDEVLDELERSGDAGFEAEGGMRYPQFYLIEESRSLVGKEKQGQGSGLQSN